MKYRTVTGKIIDVFFEGDFAYVENGEQIIFTSQRILGVWASRAWDLEPVSERPSCRVCGVDLTSVERAWKSHDVCRTCETKIDRTN